MDESVKDGKLKEVKFENKQFIANGKTYHIEETISYDRWIKFRKLEIKLMYGVDGSEMFGRFKEIYTLLNQKNSEVVQAGIIAYNSMESIKEFDDRIPEVCQMCALFCNTEDEDRKDINAAQIKAKVDDWRKEGISMNSFFLLASHLIPNFLKIYEDVTQSTSPTSQK